MLSYAILLYSILWGLLLFHADVLSVCSGGACVCVCVRACMRPCVRVRARVCVCVCERVSA